MNMTLPIPVSGMSCAACQSHVQDALQKAPGIQSAAVNLMLRQAQVDYDPQHITPEQIVRAVNESGYTAHLPSSAATLDSEQEELNEYRSLRRNTIFAMLAGVVATILSMPLMLNGTDMHRGSQHDPLMGWAMNVLAHPLKQMWPGLFAFDPKTLGFILAGLSF